MRWGVLFCGFTNETRSLPPLPGSRTSPKSYEGGGRERFGREGRHKCLLGGDKYERGRKKIKKGDRKRQPTFSLLESVLGEKKGENK